MFCPLEKLRCGKVKRKYFMNNLFWEELNLSVYFNFARVLRKPLSLLIFCTGLFVTYLYLKPTPQHMFTFGDNLLQVVLEMVGLLLALPILLPKSIREQARGGFSQLCLSWWMPKGSVVPLLLACSILS